MKFDISIDKHLVDVSSATPTKVIIEATPIKVEIENQSSIKTEVLTSNIKAEIQTQPLIINTEINVSKFVVEVGATIGIGSNITPVWGGIVGDINNQTDLIDELDLKENSLGNPSVDDYVLSSKTDGTRSWVVQSGGGGAWGEITGTLSEQTDLQSALDAKEADLGTPSLDGQVLASTVAGFRSWVTKQNILPTTTLEVTNFAADAWVNIATLPLDSLVYEKDLIVDITAVTPLGTCSDLVLILNLAWNASNYASMRAQISSFASHSYSSSSTTENGLVIVEARVGLVLASNIAVLQVRKYKDNSITIYSTPRHETAWEFRTGTVTSADATPSNSRTTSTGAGINGDNITANYASTASYATGLYNGYTISNTNDNTGKWEYFANILMSYSSTYRYGLAHTAKFLLHELDSSKDADELDVIEVTLSASLPTVANNTAFNTTTPSIYIEINGKTNLTADDFAVLVYSTSTSSKSIRAYIKLKDANTVYGLIRFNLYGGSYSSTRTVTSSYCTSAVVTAQAVLADLPTPAQGDIVYGTNNSLGLYSKLAIPITIAQAKALSDASALIPSQWYLITDYQTTDYVFGSDCLGEQELHTGDVEQIYLKASNYTQFEPEGVSKTYPDETIEFSSNETIYTEYSNGTATTDGDDIYSSGDYTFDIVDATTLSIDSSISGFTDKILSYYIEMYDNDNGASYYFDSIHQLNKAWTWNNSTLQLGINNVLLTSAEYDTDTSIGDETLTIVSTSSFSLTNFTTFDYVFPQYEGGSIYVEDRDNEVSYSYTWDDYGVTWEITSSGVITLLNAGAENIVLTNDVYIYLDWGITDLQPATNIDYLNSTDCYFDIALNLKLATVWGKIIARKNVIKEVYAQVDYRGTKVRRAKPDVDDWASGSYTRGDYVNYSGIVYLCIETHTSSTTPSANNSNWCQLFANDYFMPCNYMYLYGFTLSASDDYEDFDIFNVASLDATSETINLKMYANSYGVCNIMIRNTSNIYSFKNCILGSTGTKGLTILGSSASNLVLYGETTICDTVSNSNIDSVTDSYLKNFIRVPIAMQIRSCIINSLYDSEITYLGGSCIKFNSTSNTGNKIYSASGLDIRSTFLNNRIIKATGTSKFRGELTNNYMQYLYSTNDFQSNIRNTSFFGETYGVTLTGQLLSTLFFGNFYTTTLGYTSGATFFNNCGNNVIDGGMNIINSTFMSSFSNNSFTASSSNSKISYITCLSAFAYNNDKGIGLWFENDFFVGNTSYITNEGSYKCYIRKNLFLGTVGGSGTDQGLQVNKYGSAVQYIDDNSFGGFLKYVHIQNGDFKNNKTNDIRYMKTGSSSYKATLEYNEFGIQAGGDATNYLLFGSTAETYFGFNDVGKYFQKNVINGTYQYNIFPNGYQSQTISGGFSYLDLYNTQCFLKYTVTDDDTTTIPSKYSYFFIDASSGDTTAYLPEATGSGKILSFYALNLDNDGVIDAFENSGKINGNNTYTFTNVGDSIKIIDYDENDWRIVSHYHTISEGIDATVTYTDTSDDTQYVLTFEKGILIDRREA